MIDSLIARVSSKLVEVADTIVLPRFQHLQTGQFEEKSPGDWVTVVDRESEALLTPYLQALIPGSQVVGEEAYAANPALLQTASADFVWLVDPLDGTNNFVAGSPDFAVMVALMQKGATVASWVLHPCTRQMYAAELGAGAYCGDQPLHASQLPVPADALRGTVRTRFLPEPLKTTLVLRMSSVAASIEGTHCAGIDYPRLIAGEPDFMLYWRTHPWDHAPTTLILTEAGGHAARPDGRPYRPLEEASGLLVAPNEAVWSTARGVLFG